MSFGTRRRWWRSFRLASFCADRDENAIGLHSPEQVAQHADERPIRRNYQHPRGAQPQLPVPRGRALGSDERQTERLTAVLAKMTFDMIAK
jgi:hypothetical protein